MAANDPRIEVRLPRETRRRLEELRREIRADIQRPVSMSKLVKTILDQFFERADLLEKEKR